MARTQGSHGDITGPRIRDAALRLFARDGFAAVSMRQIAADVGVQAGALYNYTPDKQTLLFDLMQSHMEALLGAMPKDAGPALVRLEQFVLFHLSYHRDRAAEIFLAYNELRNLNEGNFKELQSLRRRYETALEGILRDGVAEGAMQLSDVQVTTKAIIAMLTGVTTWFRDDGRLSHEDVAGIYWEMVEQLVKGR